MVDHTIIKIIEEKIFTKDFNKLVGVKERHLLHQTLAHTPQIGDLIIGGGGLRKLRWSRPGMGKRGGVRIIYYFYNTESVVCLLTIFAKNAQVNLSQNELKLLAKALEIIKARYQREKYDQ